MLGGTVVGIIRYPDHTLLHVEDKQESTTIRVRETRRDTGAKVEINLGDRVWWQCQTVLWTPKDVRPSADHPGCGKRWDIHLPKHTRSET